MKKYTEVLKENNNYFYLHCEECDEVYIDDLYYLVIQKFCPKCSMILSVIRGEQKLNEEQVREVIKQYIKQQKIDKVRKNNLIIN
jgi:hypothetical protein